MTVGKQANDVLLGEKIIVVYNSIKKGPNKLQTRARHNAQYMTVEGDNECPATAVLDIRLHYIKDR